MNNSKIYEFGTFDYTEFIMSNTCMDTVPYFKVRLKENVDKDRLSNAIKVALSYHEIFKTKIKKGYTYKLIENNLEYKLERISDSTFDFGRTTNNFLFRLAYENNIIELSCCHGLTDGRGMSKFLTTILESYFGLPITYEKEESILSFENIVDKNVKSFGIKKQKKGFTSKDLPHIKNKSACVLTNYTLKTEELLRLTKKADASPATLLLPLLSKALYQSLPPKSKDKAVKAYLLADLRKIVNINTSRNCIGYRYISYTKDFEKYDISMLSTIYRGMLDLFLEKENVISFVNSLNKDVSIFKKLPYPVSKLIAKLSAPFVKNDINLYLTYIGKLSFSQELCEHIDDVDIVVYPDSGYLTLAILDFNGTLKLSLCNLYKSDKIESNFYNLLTNIGLDVKTSSPTSFKQAHLK